MEIKIYKLKNGLDIIGKVEKTLDRIILHEPLFLKQLLNEIGNIVIMFKKLNEPYSQKDIKEIDITDEIFYEYETPIEEITNKYFSVISGIEMTTKIDKNILKN